MKKALLTFKNHYGSMLLLLAIIALGVVLMIVPTITGRTLLAIAGWALFLAGVIKISQYFIKGIAKAIQGWGLSKGMLMLLGSLVLLIVPDMLIEMMPLLLGVIFLLGAVLKFQISFDLKRLTYKKWYISLVFTALSIICGWLTILHPFGIGDVVMRLTGALLIIEAIFDAVHLLLFQHQKNRYQMPEKPTEGEHTPQSNK